VTVGKLLHHRGILYLPDYVVNAGGLISIMAEVGRGGFQKEKVTKKISAIQKTAERIIESSKRTRVSTSEVADRLSRDIFSKR
jgi:leucine dehydrogenase